MQVCRFINNFHTDIQNSLILESEKAATTSALNGPKSLFSTSAPVAVTQQQESRPFSFGLSSSSSSKEPPTTTVSSAAPTASFSFGNTTAAPFSFGFKAPEKTAETEEKGTIYRALFN